MSGSGNNRNRVAILVALVGVTALLHYVTPTEPHQYHVAHIVLRKLYFLPPVIAAAWYGLRGAIITTAVVTVLFSLHAVLDWPGNYRKAVHKTVHKI